MKLLIGNFEERLRKCITFAWQIFMEKVGTELLSINKEASMQLHYTYILQQVVPLICFERDEAVEIELETSVEIDGKTRDIDLRITGKRSGRCHKIAVEMKCYRTLASSGKPRGATDIFKMGIYEDLSRLEEYCESAGFDQGVSLVMNDLKSLVHPKTKTAKSWDYDISHGAKKADIHLRTPIGGKEVDIQLKKTYEFTWINKGDFWFLEIEGC